MTTVKGWMVWPLTQNSKKKNNIVVCGGNTQRDRSILHHNTSTYMTSVRWRRRPATSREGGVLQRTAGVCAPSFYSFFINVLCISNAHLHAKTVVDIHAYTLIVVVIMVPGR